MPQAAIAVGAAVLATAGKAVGYAAFAKVMAGVAISSALSFVSRAIMSPDQSRSFGPTSTSTAGLRTLSRSSAAPSRVIYGTARTSGVLAFAEAVDAQGARVAGGRYLHFCMLVGDGPVDDIYDIRLGDDPIQGARFTNHAMFIPVMGDHDQSPLHPFATLGGNGLRLPLSWINGAHRLQGLAYVWAILNFNQEIFPGGPPQVTFTVRGRRVWDPRDATQSADDTTTWAWSNNWALCVLDYMRNTDYGLGVPDGEIDLDQAVVAANISDEVVTDVAATTDDDGDAVAAVTQRRYTCDGVFETDANRGDILRALLSAGAGALLPQASTLVLRAGAARTTTFNIGQHDLGGKVRVSPQPRIAAQVNRVEGTFINARKNWVPDSIEPQTSDAYVTADGNEERAIQLDFPFTTDPYRARRLAQIELKRRRRAETFSLTGKPTLLATQAADVGTLTLPHFGYSALPVEVLELRYDGRVEMTLTRYDSTAYTYDASGQTLIDEGPASNLPDPFVSHPPAAVTVEEDVDVQPDGTRVPKLVVTITAPTAPMILAGYRIRFYNLRDGVTTRQTLFVTHRRVELPAHKGGRYRVDVSTRNQSGRHSDAVVVDARITYLTLPPPDIKGLSAQVFGNNGVALRWELDGAQPPDLLAYRVRYVEGSHASEGAALWATALRPFGDDVVLSRAFAMRVDYPGPYTFFVRAVDTTDAMSTAVAAVVVNVPTSRRDLGTVLFEAVPMLGGWQGQRVNCQVNEAGSLEATGRTQWQQTPATWDGWAAWNELPNTMHYVDRVIDLGADVDLEPEVTVDADGTVAVLVRTQANGEDWTEWSEPTLARARSVQVRVSIAPTVGVVPMLRGLSIVLRQRVLEEIVDDFDLGALPLHQDIVVCEQSRWELGQGKQRGTSVQLNAANAYEVACDAHAAVQFTAGRVIVADAPELRLVDSFTIEFLLLPANISQSDTYLISKGANPDYAVRFHQGELSLHAVGFSGDDPTVHAVTLTDAVPMRHVAVSYDGQHLTWMLDGLVMARAATQFALATTTGDLAIGGAAPTGNEVAAWIRNARIWNHARTVSDVRSSIGDLLDGTEEGLLAAWPLDDATGSDARELRGLYGGTIGGTTAWGRVGYRESPRINLGVVQALEELIVDWTESLPASTTLTIEASVDGSTWVPVTAAQSVWAALGLTHGADLTGTILDLRQILVSTDVDVTPAFSQLITRLRTAPTVRDFTVIPSENFARIRRAEITAIQNSTTAVAASVVTRQRYGVRFRLYDPETPGGGLSPAPVIDLLLAGSAAPV